jgi:hypothetical protein
MSNVSFSFKQKEKYKQKHDRFFFAPNCTICTRNCKLAGFKVCSGKLLDLLFWAELFFYEFFVKLF